MLDYVKPTAVHVNTITNKPKCPGQRLVYVGITCVLEVFRSKDNENL